MDSLNHWNELSNAERREAARGWCGADRFSRTLGDHGPLACIEDAHRQADECFDSFTDQDWLEAFASHPRLGDVKSLQMKFVGNRQWSADEQSGTDAADPELLQRLAEWNEKYFQRFGHIFILKATGVTATQMVRAIEQRLTNSPEDERRIAADHQRQITHLRIDKFFQ